MAFVKLRSAKYPDRTYVYDRQKVWDPEKGKYRYQQKLVGLLDPKTGDILPTGRPGRKSSSAASGSPAEADPEKSQLLQDEQEIKQLRIELAKKDNEIQQMLKINRRALSEARKAVRGLEDSQEVGENLMKKLIVPKRKVRMLKSPSSQNAEEVSAGAEAEASEPETEQQSSSDNSES